ncbi:MAG TPA: hypothetical protein PLY93_11465 [Turneriella sp.]|nr:hypothetical protein [Turneriella sp.]
MKRTLKIILVLYLIILFVLSLLPLTGYYAALGVLPVLSYYLYRKIILKEKNSESIVTRGVFLLACVVFLLGFVLNMFCTLYTTYRMAEFRSTIEEQKKEIYTDIHKEENRKIPPETTTPMPGQSVNIRKK